MRLPSGFFEEGIHYLTSLYDFTFEGPSQTYHHLFVRSLEAEAGLYEFKVEVYRKSIELQIAEKMCNTSLIMTIFFIKIPFIT